MCSLQGRFLAVDAEMRLCAACSSFLHFSATNALWCGVGRVSIVIEIEIHWMGRSMNGRVNRKSGCWQSTPGRHFTLLPAVPTRFARICILQEKMPPSTPDDQKRVRVSDRLLFPSNQKAAPPPPTNPSAHRSDQKRTHTSLLSYYHPTIQSTHPSLACVNNTALLPLKPPMLDALSLTDIGATFPPVCDLHVIPFPFEV